MHLLVALLMLPAATGGQADASQLDVDAVVQLLDFVIDSDAGTARKCLGILTAQVQSRELRGKQLEQLRLQLTKTIEAVRRAPDHPLAFDAVLLAASWGDSNAVATANQVLLDKARPAAQRLSAIDALAAGAGRQLLQSAAPLLADEQTSVALRAQLLAGLGRTDEAGVAPLVLDQYAQLSAALQPKAIELLTGRPAWSKSLLQAIGRQQIPASALNVNQVAKLLASRDQQLVELVRAKWGSVRSERNPQREQVIVEMRALLDRTAGDALRGQQVFNKICGQCHKIHGQGQEVGPDITRNGRASFDQLLSNVFDPSLVIGAAYQARTVITAKGRVLTGLVTEDNAQRIVLKTQGGKLEIIPRGDVDEVYVSKLSLMPEGIEKQLQPQELADLFAFLALDRPPDDPNAALKGKH